MSQRTKQLDRSYLTDLFHRVLLGWQVVLHLEVSVSRRSEQVERSYLVDLFYPMDLQRSRRELDLTLSI